MWQKNIWTKSSHNSYKPVKQSFVVQEGRESHFYCLIAGNYAGPVMKQIINHSVTCLYEQDKGRVQYSELHSQLRGTWCQRLQLAVELSFCSRTARLTCPLLWHPVQTNTASGLQVPIELQLLRGSVTTSLPGLQHQGFRTWVWKVLTIPSHPESLSSRVNVFP